MKSNQQDNNRIFQRKIASMEKSSPKAIRFAMSKNSLTSDSCKQIGKQWNLLLQAP